MIDIQTEKRLVKYFVWLMAGIALLIILASCSAAASPVTPTAKATQIPPRSATMTSPPAAASSPTPAPSCRVSTGYNTGNLNLRAGAGVGYEVIRVLREGEVLKVIERAAWLEVIDARGNQGFINARYCK
jgi:uncharacterized protein YgiM (DUF1202 family)